MAPNSIILSVIFLLLLSISPSLESDNVMRFAKKHLKAFGYLSGDYKSTDDDTYDEALVCALRKYQTFFGLSVSGRIDPDTLMMMSRPRCGVPDRPSTDDVHNITPKYAFYQGKPAWPKTMKKFKYTFLTVPPIPSRKVSAAISSAFSTWSAATGFTFEVVRNVSKPAEIRIGFYRGDHGDGHPFDGRSGVVAHSFPPRIGLLHFDVDENWGTVQAADILDLESIALHEIGHILGLEHSDRPSAVMFPTHRYGLIKRHLDNDDIDGIHALYAD